MILTVTPNSALDKVFLIDEFIPGTTHRVKNALLSVGGKGLDASVTLRNLGVDTVGLVFTAGKTGMELIELVNSYGIISEPIWVNGETRTAHVISETRIGRHSHLISGNLSINEQHLDEFMTTFRKHVHNSTWVICAGSIPPSLSTSIYRLIADESMKASVPVLIDSSHEPVIRALSASPTIIKMNWFEFQNTFSVQAPSLDQLIDQASLVFNAHNLNSLVITCSSEGILAFCKEGYYHAIVPKLKPVNAAESGDAVSATLAWRLSEGDRWIEALQWSGAVAAAVVLTERTAECRMEDVKKLFTQVYVEKL